MGVRALLRIGARALAQQLARWAERTVALLDEVDDAHEADDAPPNRAVPDRALLGPDAPLPVSADGPPADWIERVRRGAPWLLEELPVREPRLGDGPASYSGPGGPSREAAKRVPPQGAEAMPRPGERPERTRAAGDAFAPRQADERPLRGEIDRAPNARPPDVRPVMGGAPRAGAAPPATEPARRPPVFSSRRPEPRGPLDARPAGTTSADSPVAARDRGTPSTKATQAARPRAETGPAVRGRGQPRRPPPPNAEREATTSRPAAALTPPRLVPNEPLESPPPVPSRAPPPLSGEAAYPTPATADPFPALGLSPHAARRAESAAVRPPRAAREPATSWGNQSHLVSPDTPGTAAPAHFNGVERHPWPELPDEPPAPTERATADALREAERWRRVRLEQEGMPWSG